MSRRLERGLGKDGGIALILALVFVVLLAAIVTEFAYGMQVDALLIGQESTETDAYLAAKSAIGLSESVLAADLIIGEDEAQKNATGVYDSLDEPWAKSTPVVQYNDAMVSIQIADEYGKINLNALLYVDASGTEVEFTPLVQALRYLFEKISPDHDPVDAILDWLDADDTPRTNGFERDYYEKLDPPIHCKNGPMDSLEELLLIPGVSQAMYFAEPEKKVEPPIPQFSEMLTVHGNPEGRVNVNTAPADVLDAMLAVATQAGGVTATTDQVLQRLKSVGPYTSRKELRTEGVLPTARRRPGAPNPAEAQGGQEEDDKTPNSQKPPDLFDVRSSVFRVRGESQIGDVSVSVEAYIWRDTAQEDAPGQQAGSGAAQLFRIIDWRVLS